MRLVAATHRDLAADVEVGRFRQGLYYRLHVIPIHLPSLAERREDIRALAQHCVSRANQARTLAAALLGQNASPYEHRATVVRVKTTTRPLTLH